MLFEVKDLSKASPATVSRCGMVYIPSDVTGWKPYVQSWLAALPLTLSTDDKEVAVSTQVLLLCLHKLAMPPGGWASLVVPTSASVGGPMY